MSSNLIVDAKCRMAEVYRKVTQGSVLAWRAASFLFGETSLVVLTLSCERGIEGRLQSEPMWG